MRHRVSFLVPSLPDPALAGRSLTPFCIVVGTVLLAAALSAEPAAAEGTPTNAAAVTIGDKKIPTTLREIGNRLDKLIDLIEALRKEAKRDPDEGKITIYENYTPDDFKDRKRKVRAEHLAAFMSDTTKDMDVRKRAYEALKDGVISGDPDLTKDKKGNSTKRGRFTDKHILYLIKGEDKSNRKFAKALLDVWFFVRNVKAILDYDLDKPKTWKPAHDVWKREIKKRRN